MVTMLDEAGEDVSYLSTSLSTSLTLSLPLAQVTGETKYEVRYEERCGRLVVAATHIRAGDLVLSDPPAATGPDNNPRAVCLVCCARLVRGHVVTCRQCGWPLCSDTCRDHIGPHHRECELFRRQGIKFDINDVKTTCPSYNGIMVLRLLWLRDNDSETWDKIDRLMDHREDNSEKTTHAEDRVITFIRVFCRLSQYSRSLILRVIGIIDTNAYIIGENRNKNVDIQGLFPTCSIINHSCQANTVCFATEDLRFVCRAVVDIPRGAEITTNYLYYQYHCFGNTYRVSELQDYWHFSCNCDRCGDPGELGSGVDRVLCDQCGQHTLTPAPGPLCHYSSAPWSCLARECSNTKPGPHIAAKIDETWNYLQDNVWTNLSGQISILESLLHFFGEKHYYVMEVKRRIIELIGGDENSYDDVEEELLRKKLDYCDEHLKLADILSPGLTEFRAYMSLHRAQTIYQLMTRGHMKSDPETVMTLFDHLDTVILIWRDYRLGSIESGKVELAELLKEEIETQFGDSQSNCEKAVRKFA